MTPRWYLKACQFTVCLGFIAVIAGWTTTEVGRQPWTIYGLMRTANSFSPSLTGANVLLSLILYVVVYLIIFPTGIYTMLRFVWRGPAATEDDAPVVSGRPKSPIEALVPATVGDDADDRALDLVPIWTAILAIGVFFYVALDGFDLGVGMLYNFAPDRHARDLVMNSIAPIWDGNETWLILGSVGLLAAFPVAFAIIIPAVYFPILLMLLALDLPRPGLRIPLPRRRAPHVLGSRLCRGLSAGGFRPRRRARLVHPGLPGRRPPLRRRLVRLLHAVFDFLRHRPDVRLWPARRRLADHQDRRRFAGLGAGARPDA